MDTGDPTTADETGFPSQVALGYVAVAGAYILLSGRAAAALATSTRQLEQIERFKGIGFVLVTGALLFLLCRRFVRQVAAEGAALRRTREALAAADRRTVPGLMAASIAHDANNGLALVQGYLELLAEEPGLGAEAREAVEAARGGVTAVVAMNRRLADSARERAAGERVGFDLVQVVRDSAALLVRHRGVRSRRLETQAPGAFSVQGFPGLVHQIVVNLVLNAADATAPGGRIRLRVEADDDEARLEVADDGPGFAPEVQARAFEAFRTTKPEGTGIGLFSVKHCAEIHGGRVELGRSDLGGARVSVWIPRQGAAEAAAYAGRVARSSR